MIKTLFALALITLWLCSCGGGRRVDQDGHLPPVVKERPAESESRPAGDDRIVLSELAGRQVISADEALRASDQLLREDRDGPPDAATLDQLEKVLFKSLPQAGKQDQPLVLRNLGILHYYKKDYQKSRQELQAANELNPRDARTHYYLACLFHNQARLLAAKGQHRKSRASLKRAKIEIDRARTLAPSNSLYRQDFSTIKADEHK